LVDCLPGMNLASGLIKAISHTVSVLPNLHVTDMKSERPIPYIRRELSAIYGTDRDFGSNTGDLNGNLKVASERVGTIQCGRTSNLPFEAPEATAGRVRLS